MDQSQSTKVHGIMTLVFSLMGLSCASVPTIVPQTPPQAPESVQGTVFDGEWRLNNVQMLTSGGENAEAYFSADGEELIFQATRDGFQCDQIFRMNVDGTNVRLVSTGLGRTTCSYILPDDSGIVYSSTHATVKTCPPRPDQSKNYVWPLLADFEIYKAGPNGENPVALAPSPGYDAQAVVSPVGDRIVFTSTRGGDVDIWTMSVDGTDLKQLTHEEGYDGGAFFSRDGSKIVYRAHHPEGAALEAYRALRAQNLVRPGIMDLWVMDSDGANKQKILSNGSANFAPYLHPDGKRIIFSSNMDDPGGRNFDLYLINADGSGLERVTYNVSFDSFPMFSHDGSKLVFASNRDGAKEGDTNVFMADWNDVPPDFAEVRAGQPEDDAMFSDIVSLSADAFEGRGLGTKGLGLAADWLEAEFKKVGLNPLNGSYRDTLDVAVRSKIEDSSAEIGGSKPTVFKREEVSPLTFSSSGEVTAEVVFAGYGLSTSEYDYDDYTALDGPLDVEGKIVVVMRYEPQRQDAGSRFSGNQPIRESELRYKALNAKHRGAKAVVVVNPKPLKGEEDVLMKFAGMPSELGIPVVHMTSKAATRAFGKSFAALSAKIDETGQPNSGKSLGEMKLKISITRELEKVANIVGMLPATSQPSTGMIVVGAHYDHLGYGGDSSMRPGVEAIHPGADDNASGVAMMLELARRLQNVSRKRDIVFVGFTGEESGLLGSTHFVAAGPLKDQKIDAMINLDMVGRLRDAKLHVMGVGTGMTLRDIVRRESSGLGLQLILEADGHGPSDHMSFYLHKIPVLSLFTGVHEHYHTPDDRPETLHREGIQTVATYALRLAEALANEDAPAYVTVRSVATADRGGDGSRGYGPSFGSVPAFGDSTQPGVKVSGARQGSAAEASGLQADDVIIRFGEFDVANLHDFAFALRQHKAGQEIDVVVIRKGEEKTLKAVLGTSSK